MATPAAIAHETHISGRNNITLTIAKEMITDFDGNYPIKLPINIWVSQLMTIASMYKLSGRYKFIDNPRCRVIESAVRSVPHKRE